MKVHRYFWEKKMRASEYIYIALSHNIHQMLLLKIHKMEYVYNFIHRKHKMMFTRKDYEKDRSQLIMLKTEKRI